MAVIVFSRSSPTGFTERESMLPHPPCACCQPFLDTFGTWTILEWSRLGSPIPGGCRGVPPASPAHLATAGFPRGKGEGRVGNEADEIQGRLFGSTPETAGSGLTSKGGPGPFGAGSRK